jgi:hypothetical protein
MAEFPSLQWFKTYQRLLEESENFKKNCKWFKGSIIFRIDQRPFRMEFDYGIVTDVYEGYKSYDVLITGSLEAWNILLYEDKAINRIIRYGLLEIRGNPTEIMKNWKAIFYITQGLKKVAT